MYFHHLISVGLGALLAASALAGPHEDHQTERLWTVYWRQFAPHYAELDGSFSCFPELKPGIRNSTGRTAKDYEKTQSFNLTVSDDRGGEEEQTLRKPNAEVVAAVEVLPDFSPGSFGTIDSGEVSEIIADDEARLSSVWLINADQVAEDREADREVLRREVWGEMEDAFRRGWRRGGGFDQPRVSDRAADLRDAVDWRFAERDAVLKVQRANAQTSLIVHGFKTSAMTEGQRWPGKPGVEIAIIMVEDGGGYGTRVHALPLAVARRGLTESRFAAMLETRGLTREQFLEIVQRERLASPTSYHAAVLAAIEGAGNDGDAGGNDDGVRGGEVLLAE